MIRNRWAAGLLMLATAVGGALAGAGPAAGQGATSPHGPSLDIPCSACHTTDGWTPARQRMAFSHASTGFPLVGAHERAECAACHLGLRFDEPGGPAECASCHVDVHQGRLSSQCEDCHQPESWRGERERIMAHSRTSFPLMGAHLRLDCEACHRDERAGAYTGLDPACWSCHSADYRGTVFPDHEASGYDHECRTCHGTATWRGARFDHADRFPLIGAHATAPCATCHQGPNREVLWSPADEYDCVACHRAEYDREHGGLGYPLDCTTCHTVDSWGALSFDHDGQFFPINSGSHRGTWRTCLECHPSAQNFALFTCLTCHRQSSTSGEHDEVSGYVYESTACLSCHPRGRAEDD